MLVRVRLWINIGRKNKEILRCAPPHQGRCASQRDADRGDVNTYLQLPGKSWPQFIQAKRVFHVLCPQVCYREASRALGHCRGAPDQQHQQHGGRLRSNAGTTVGVMAAAVLVCVVGVSSWLRSSMHCNLARSELRHPPTADECR